MAQRNALKELLSPSNGGEIPGIGSTSDLGIYDIWKTRCARCAKACFVLAGMSIDFSGEAGERNLAFVRSYMLQKPLQCSTCSSFLCAACAAAAADCSGISGVIITPLGEVFRTACPFCVISKVEFA